jgi:pimeloyl-ACP methyl ester carboxylesterase
MRNNALFNEQKSIAVKEIGSFHIGGREIFLSGLPTFEVVWMAGGLPMFVDPNGGYESFQMYVQYVKLENPSAKYPLLLWHGGGLSGVTWETKPDGQPGFQQRFLQAGNDVYVSDAVERGRASWARWPEINTKPPVWRPKIQAWENFRIGPKFDPDPGKRQPYEDCKFPYEYFDQFCKQSIPRFPSAEAEAFAGYQAYMDECFADGCVIMAHSQGSAFAYDAALNHPEKVKAVILLEPSPIPGDQSKIERIKHIPFIYIYGDVKNEYWQNMYKKQLNFSQILRKQGNDITWIDLVQLGVKGNTHMLMMDKNSDDIAAMIIDWMREKNLYK